MAAVAIAAQNQPHRSDRPLALPSSLSSRFSSSPEVPRSGCCGSDVIEHP